MIENEKAQSSEKQTNKEWATAQKPNGIMIKKINRKIFVTEISFDKESREIFQDKLLKVVLSEHKKWKNRLLCIKLIRFFYPSLKVSRKSDSRKNNLKMLYYSKYQTFREVNFEI